MARKTHSDLLAERQRLQARIAAARARRESIAALDERLRAITLRLIKMEMRDMRRSAA